MVSCRIDEARGTRLLIAAGGEWFQIVGRTPVTLKQRAPLRRLLFALAELKVRSPDAVLSVTAAFEAGWPGERATANAAAMRVYTAIHSLRRLGLRGLLVRRSRGYVLDVEVDITSEDEGVSAIRADPLPNGQREDDAQNVAENAAESGMPILPRILIRTV
jgi:hypothetical protein